MRNNLSKTAIAKFKWEAIHKKQTSLQCLFLQLDLTYIFPIIVVVRVLVSQSRSPGFKTTGWLQGQIIFPSFQGRLNKYQQLLGTEW